MSANSKRAWKQRNPERVRAQGRKDAARRRARDPEGCREAERLWREKNKARVNQERRRRYAKNPEPFRERHFRGKYGISLAERDDLLASQGQRCASCLGLEPGHKLGWQLDHCHTTGKIRGILCHSCNVALGQAKESATRLRLLADYIERHNG